MSLNRALAGAVGAITNAGVQVLHVTGPKHLNEIQPPPGPVPYVAVPYVDQMDLAYAAADFALCRAGAMTCAELTAVGLPAAYVPLPHGNGEQRLNALPIVQRGGGLLVDDAELTAEWIRSSLLPVLTNIDQVAGMSEAAGAMGRKDADRWLAKAVIDIVAAEAASRAAGPARARPPAGSRRRAPRQPPAPAPAGAAAAPRRAAAAAARPGRQRSRAACSRRAPPATSRARAHAPPADDWSQARAATRPAPRVSPAGRPPAASAQPPGPAGQPPRPAGARGPSCRRPARPAPASRARIRARDVTGRHGHSGSGEGTRAMALVTPTEPVPLEELGRVHFVGLGGAGHVRHRPDHAGQGGASLRQRHDRRLGRAGRAGGARRPGLRRPRGRPARRRGHAGRVQRDQGGRPGAGRGEPPGPAGGAPRRRARLADGRPPGHRGDRDPRQDQHHLDDRDRADRDRRGAGPAYAIGGVLAATGVGAADGDGPYFVAEADESDGSFLMYSPDVAVVTNVDADHLDNYGTEAAYRASFAAFLGRIKPGGLLVTCADDSGTRDLAAQARALGLRVVSYGESPDADYRIAGVTTSGMETSFSACRASAGRGGAAEPAEPRPEPPGSVRDNRS